MHQEDFVEVCSTIFAAKLGGPHKELLESPYMADPVEVSDILVSMWSFDADRCAKRYAIVTIVH